MIHLYLGIFITPAIFFFALTGTLQTFQLHESTKGSDYEPTKWIMTLAQVHKNQTIVLPARRPQPEGVVQSDGNARPLAPTLSKSKGSKTLPMKIYFLLVAVGLVVSTLTGLYMSYKFSRNRKAMVAALLAGIAIPAVLLLV